MLRPEDFDYDRPRRRQAPVIGAYPEKTTAISDLGITKGVFDNDFAKYQDPVKGYNAESDPSINLDRKMTNGARGSFVSPMAPGKNALSRVRKR